MDLIYGFCTEIVVPKNLLLKNVRLALLLRILQALCLAFIIREFLSSEKYLQFAEVHSSTKIWPNPRYKNDTDKDILSYHFENTYCRDPNAYNFDFDQDFKYSNITCLVLANHERRIRQNNGLFVPTFLHERNFFNREPQDGQCTHLQETGCESWVLQNVTSTQVLCHCVQESQFFVVGPEEVSFSLQILPTFIFKGGMLDSFVGEEDSRNLFEYRMLLNGYDVNWDINHPKAEIKVLKATPKPIESLDLATKDVLHAANIDLSARNKLHKSQNETHLPLTYRLQGVQIQGELVYDNPVGRSIWNSFRSKGPTHVTLIFRPVVQQWSVREIVNYAHFGRADEPEHSRLQTLHGVDISFDLHTSKYAKLIPDHLFIEFMAAVVLLGLPIKLVTFLMYYCLGQLSSCIYSFSNEKFHLPSKFMNTMSRALSLNTEFRLLSEGESRIISRAQFHGLITATISKSKVLDGKEIREFSEYLYDQYLQSPFVSETGRKPVDKEELSKEMGLNEYVSGGLLGSVGLSWQNVATCIDADRKRYPLERFFEDHELRTLRKFIMERRKWSNLSSIEAHPDPVTIGHLEETLNADSIPPSVPEQDLPENHWLRYPQVSPSLLDEIETYLQGKDKQM